MAQYGQKTITINVDCNTSAAEAKVNNLAQSVDRIEKNGKIVLDAQVDTSKLSEFEAMAKKKEIEVDIKANNFKELEKAAQTMQQFPTLGKSASSQLKSTFNGLKNQTKGLFDDLISKNQSQKLEETTSKLRDLIKNPIKNENGRGYDERYANELNAYLEMYRRLQGARKQMFELSNGHKSSFQTISDSAPKMEHRDTYNDILEKYEKSYEAGKKRIESLKNKIVNNATGSEFEGLVNLPKFDYDIANDYWEKALMSRSTDKITPQIDIAQIRNEIENALSNIPVTLNVDDDIARIKTELTNIPVNLNIGDDLGKIRSELSAITSAENIGGKPITFNVEVQPSIESIQEKINSLPEKKQISISINTGDSLQNLKALTQGLNDYDLQGTLKNLKSISQSFNYAFKNVNSATNAPMNILKNMNSEVAELKTNLKSIGVTKFDESKTMQNNLAKWQKQVQEQTKNIVNEGLKDTQNTINEVKKQQKQNTSTSSEQKQANSKTLTQSQYDSIQGASKKAKDVDDNISNIVPNIQETLSQSANSARELVTNLSHLKVGDAISDSDVNKLSDLNAKLKTMKEYTSNNQNYLVNKNGRLLENSSLDFYDGLNNTSDANIKKQVEKVLKAHNIEYENLKRAGTKELAYDYTYRDGDKLLTNRAYIEAVNSASKTAQLRQRQIKESDYQGAGKKWLTGFTHKFSNLAQYIAGAEIQNLLLSQFKEGLSFIKEYDSALTNIGMTMQATQGQLLNLGKEAINTGKDLGTSATDVIDASKIYANANETADSVLEKSQATIKLKNASGSDISTVADQVQGVIQQFDGLEGKENRIVNSYEKISAGLGIDFAKGINIMSDATQNAGSIANEAGMSFENFIASVGKISEVTRQDGSVVGNAYKTILARISRSKSADSDVSDQDRSDAAKALSTVGISTYDSQGNFKDITEILDELSGKWNNLTDATKNYIAEQAAGVRGVNTFKALMSTWDDSKTLAQSALDDTDFIDEVQDKYMDSIEGKMNTVTANVQEFWNTLISASSVKTIVGGFNAIVGGINSLVSASSKLSGNNDILKNLMVFGVTSGLYGLGDSFLQAKTELTKSENAYGITDILKKTGSNWLKGAKSVFTNDKASQQGVGILDAFKGGFNSPKFNSGDYSGLTGNLARITSGAKSAWTAMSTLGKVITGVGVAVAVWQVASGIFDHFTTSADEAKEALANVSQKYTEQTTTLKKNQETVSSIKGEWADLSKGVDTSNNENVSLTSTEYERYLELNKQIADIVPSTISGYDAQGNAILKLKGNVDLLNEAMEKQEVNQAKKRLTKDNIEKYQDVAKQLNGNDSFFDKMATYLSKGWKGIKNGSGRYYDEIYGRQNAYNQLSALKKINTKDKFEEFKNSRLNINPLTASVEDYDFAGYMKDMFGKIETYADWKKVLRSSTLQEELEEQKSYIKEVADTNKNVLNDYITTLTKGDGKYANLSESLSNNIATILSKTPDETINKLTEKGNLKSFASKYFSKISASSEAQSALTRLMGLGNETDITKIQNSLDKDIKTLSKTLGVGKKQLLSQLDLGDSNKAIQSLDTLYSTLDKKTSKQQSKIIKKNKEIAETNKEAQKELEYASTDRLKKEQKADDYNNIANGGLESRTGNVSNYRRKVLDTQTYMNDLISKGWAQNEEEAKKYGDYITSLSTFKEISNSDALKGAQIQFTPILPDGTILSKDTVNQYIDSITEGTNSKQDVLNKDRVGMDINGQWISGLVENVSSITQSRMDSMLSNIQNQMSRWSSIDLTDNNSDNDNIDSYISSLKNYVSDQICKTFSITDQDSRNAIYNSINDSMSSALQGVQSSDEISEVLTKNFSSWANIAKSSMDTYNYNLKQNKLYEDDYKALKKIGKLEKTENKSKQKLSKFIADNNLHTSDQLDLLNKCVAEAENLETAFRQYETQQYKVEVDMTSLDDLKANLETVKNEIDEINTAKSDSNSSSGLTLDDIDKVKNAYSSLAGYDYDKLFEQTYSGIHLNTRELAKLQAQYESTEYSKYTSKIETLQKKYQGLCADIGRTSDAKEKLDLIQQRDSVAKDIEQAKEYQSIFEGLTNSVTKWQNAQSYSLTQDIGSGYEDAKKLFDDGWIGDEKFQAFTQLFTNKNLAGSTSDVYEQVFAQNEERMKKYFAEGRQGVNNFIQDVAKTVPEAKGLIDEAGNVDWTKMPSVKTLSEAMDLDKSLIDAMFKELNRAGADLDFSEEADNLRQMRDAAAGVNEQFGSFSQLDDKGKVTDKVLKSITSDTDKIKNFSFNLDATDEALDDQIDTANLVREALVKAYGEGADEVKNFDKQLDYLLAKQGSTITENDLKIDGVDTSLSITDKTDRKSLKNTLSLLKEIDGYKDLYINLKATNLTEINRNLSNLKQKIIELQDENGNVDITSTEGQSLLQLYTANQNARTEKTLKKSELQGYDLTNTNTSGKEAINTLKEYQKLSIELANKQELQNLFGKDLDVNIDETKKSITSLFDKITNSSKEVKQAFKNLGYDLNNINFSNFNNALEKTDKFIQNVDKSDLQGVNGSAQANAKVLKKSRKSAKDAQDRVNNIIAGNSDYIEEHQYIKDTYTGKTTMDKSGNYFEPVYKSELIDDSKINLDVNSIKGLNAELDKCHELISSMQNNPDIYSQEDFDAVNNTMSYLQDKLQNLEENSKVNLDLNYTDNSDYLDTTLQKMEKINNLKDLKIDFKTTNLDTINKQIEDTEKKLDKFKKSDGGSVDLSKSGRAEALDAYTAEINQRQTVKNQHRAFMGVDASQYEGAQGSGMSKIQNMQNVLNDYNKAKKLSKYDSTIDMKPYKKAVTKAWSEIKNATTDEKGLFSEINFDPSKINVNDKDIASQIRKQLNGIKLGDIQGAGFDVDEVHSLNSELDTVNEKLGKKYKIDIDWSNVKPEEATKDINKLQNFLQTCTNEKGELDLSVDGAQEAFDIVNKLNQEIFQANSESNISLHVDTSELSSSTAQAVADFEQVQQKAVQLNSVKSMPNVSTEQIDAAKQDFQDALDTFNTNKTAKINIETNEGIDTASKNLDDLANKVTSVNGKQCLIDLGVKEDQITGYKPQDKTANVNYKLGSKPKYNPKDKTAYVNYKLGSTPSYDPPDINRTLTYTTKTVDGGSTNKSSSPKFPIFNGTAHVNGTARPSKFSKGKAFAKGTWGAAKSGLSLVGELGRKCFAT